jgi:hypothetical protein
MHKKRTSRVLVQTKMLGVGIEPTTRGFSVIPFNTKNGINVYPSRTL